jgi:FAD/FMN-containing dehydrogenase
VSTSAQATLGGMAGNNSCGSRSIAYGNMVHNVAGIDAPGWPTAAGAEFGRVGQGMPRPRARIADFVRGPSPGASATRSNAWPHVLRRVGGYNLDIFHPRRSAPTRPDGIGQPRAPAGRLRRHARLFHGA